VNLRIRAGEERVGWIGNINLDQQSTSGSVDRVGGADEVAGKFPAWKLGQDNFGSGLAGLDALGVFLRHVYVDTQHPGLGDVKQVGASTSTTARIDEVADIGVARGDDAIERGVDHFEGDECFVALNDGLLRRHDYVVDILGGATGLNFASDYRNVDGIIFPTKRRVYAFEGEYQIVKEPLLVAIDMGEVTLD
jgi:hypothetical protein